MDILAVAKLNAFGFYICHNSRVMTNKKRLKMAAAGFHATLHVKGAISQAVIKENCRAQLNMVRCAGIEIYVITRYLTLHI